VSVYSSPAFADTYFAYPLRDGPGWVDLSGMVLRRGGLPVLKTITHPGTNRARRRVTTLIETNALPLSQTVTTWRYSCDDDDDDDGDDDAVAVLTELRSCRAPMRDCLFSYQRKKATCQRCRWPSLLSSPEWVPQQLVTWWTSRGRRPVSL